MATGIVTNPSSILTSIVMISITGMTTAQRSIPSPTSTGTVTMRSGTTISTGRTLAIGTRTNNEGTESRARSMRPVHAVFAIRRTVARNRRPPRLFFQIGGCGDSPQPDPVFEILQTSAEESPVVAARHTRGARSCKMRIAQVAPLYESVPPQCYGGTERVVSYLTEALVDLGHRVTLFASGDSRTRGTLEPMAPRALREAPGLRDSLAPHVRMLGAVYRRAKEFDVIHCHTGYLGLPLARYVNTPTVVTLHGRLDLPETEACYREYVPNALISISDAQRAPLPEVPFRATIPHGIPRGLYPFRERSDGYLAFVGRISPEKRVDSAMRVARDAGLSLRIAAKVDPADRE